MPSPITAAISAEYREALMGWVGGKIVDKPTSLEMQIAAFVLDKALGILNAEDFLKRFSTTIANVVYLARNLDPVQLVFTLSHEAQHIRQWQEHPFTFVIIYVQSEGRAALEGESYTTTAECYWIFYGKKRIPEPETLAKSIPVAYGLSQGESKTAYTMIEQGISGCVDSGPITTVGRWTGEWFRDHHPECLSDDARAFYFPPVEVPAPVPVTAPTTPPSTRKIP